ncbi:rhomboid family intramembrane serine protease [Bowmanella denitrificans]|uniref:rhomboid family intramembrane serine protease n=1 Tax=Bowmanella denitrificans TaxID=366582 RepID=UPI000C9A4CE9|nr:rhomboid family intramembrane serine protease [Bowmanella denitrificans]
MFASRPSAGLGQSMLMACLFLCLLWWVKLAESFLGLDLSNLAVVPLQLSGLLGIITAPLVHASYLHIFSNSLPVLVLGTLLFYGYPRSCKPALLLIWLMSGLGVWLFARQAAHVGVSGVVHGMFFYLLLSSILRRDKLSVALMMVGFFLYGGMLMTIFPREPQISFEYHFFGAVAGCVASVLFQHRDPKPEEKTYQWENEEDSQDPLIGDLWQQNPQHPYSDGSQTPHEHRDTENKY